MSKYRKWTWVDVDAMQFKTNNETGCPQMDAVCIWANQGRGLKARFHCWHDGTNVFVFDMDEPSINRSRADVGDWIVKDQDGSLHVVTSAAFDASFERPEEQEKEKADV
jgi:hypothetical protein